jgi:hypothetical protein
MHGYLLQQQQRFDDANFEEFASVLGLDLERFRLDVRLPLWPTTCAASAMTSEM